MRIEGSASEVCGWVLGIESGGMRCAGFGGEGVVIVFLQIFIYFHLNIIFINFHYKLIVFNRLVLFSLLFFFVLFLVLLTMIHPYFFLFGFLICLFFFFLNTGFYRSTNSLFLVNDYVVSSSESIST